MYQWRLSLLNIFHFCLFFNIYLKFNIYSFFPLFQHYVEERRVFCVPVGSASQGNCSVMATMTVMTGVMRSIAVSFLHPAVLSESTESIQGSPKAKVGYWNRIRALHSICIYWHLDFLSCHCLTLLTLTADCISIYQNLCLETDFISS